MVRQEVRQLALMQLSIILHQEKPYWEMLFTQLLLQVPDFREI
ncbi:hypothetical protein SDC9_167346 [bioreactor metagenome]|uniref:Uncharacterized protein n=1 Tax=bioreactor metagenome TaxID=1076179 RepID=A0A645FZJ3_9ZZZZ